MDSLVSRLTHILFYPYTPSAEFLASLCKYTVPSPTVHIPIETLLRDHHPRALELYSRLVITSSVRNLVYVFVLLSTNRKNVLETVRIHLKKAALGFSVPFFNPTELSLLKNRVEFHKYSIIHKIYTNSLVYKNLLASSHTPKNTTHRYFIETIEPVVRKYEELVLSSEYDLLLFHNATHCISQQLHYLSQINDLISNHSHFKNDLLYSNSHDIPDTFLGDHFCDIRKSLFRFINECTREYFTTGIIHDPHNEYFIKDHTIIHERVPLNISKQTVETIVYVGKYTCFLVSIESLEITPEIRRSIDMLDFSVNSYTNRINEILQHLNNLLYTNFIEKYNIIPLLGFIHDVFLFGRHDFITHFFKSLKETRKVSRKNLLSVLEESLQRSFPGSPFNRVVDIFTRQDREGSVDNENTSSLLDSFGLFCHLDYPTSILLDEKFVLKLVYIFKFLWKLKKVDLLCRRIGNALYLNLVHRMQFYIFNEVIREFTNIEWDGAHLSMDLMHKSINKKLDIIMKRLFINTPEKKIEYLLYHMERAMISAGKTGEFIDANIQKSLREFYSYAKMHLEGTALQDVVMFIKMGGGQEG